MVPAEHASRGRSIDRAAVRGARVVWLWDDARRSARRCRVTSTHLQILAQRFPDVASVLVEIANLEAVLTLPKPPVHVVSDVHGEDVKLRQVINNASGSLRPLFERLFGGRMSGDDIDQLLAVMYYPRETWARMADGASPERQRELLQWIAESAAVAIRDLARHYSLHYVAKIIPDPFDAMFRELLF